MIPNLHQLVKRQPIIAQDDGQFIESQHPRDESGKFTAGGGNGGKAPQKAQVSSTLTGIFSAGGFKKSKTHNEDGSITYFNPTTKVAVKVHPAPEGKKWSSKWTSTKEGKEDVSGEGSALAKLLRVATEKAEAKTAPAPATIKDFVTAGEIKSDPGSALKKLGWEMTSKISAAGGGISYRFEKGGETLNIFSDGSWALKDTNTTGAKNSGFDYADLANALQSETAQPTGNLAGKEYNDTVDWLKTKDYKFAGPETLGGTKAIFKAPNDAKVMMDYVTGEWVAVTPGHLTKEGKGFDKLQALFNGKIEPGVKNSQQTIQTAAEKAAMTEQQKKLAEANQAAAKSAAKANATYKKLVEQAPHPTATQQNAISKYSGSGYATWNNKLRHEPGFAKTDPLTKHLDDWLKSSTFEEDVILYRKVDSDYAKILKSFIFEGTKFIDRGYSSSSPLPNVWHGSLRLVITAPKGTKGAALGKWSQHPSEHEVLLPRDSVFIVTSYDHGSDTIHVTLDQSHWKD